MTSEKLARSRPRSATIGLRNGPTMNRTPVDRNTIAANASVTHQP
jgi:hypothetical protein